MRLDKILSEQFQSRSKAQDAIEEGRIRINGKVIRKASYDLKEEDQIEIIPAKSFVSRSGHKLQAAFDAFDFSIEDQVVLDIGASTGGFTQCSLEHGARKVYALDVGHLQLSDQLKEDDRVVEMEGRNARDIQKTWFDDSIDFVCMDVSFISSLTILEPLMETIAPDHLALLVKPQFEVGRQALNKRGIVKKEKDRIQAVNKVMQWLQQHYDNVQYIDSPIQGREGNQEGMIYASLRKSR